MMANVIFVGRKNEYSRKKKRKKYFLPAKKPVEQKKITENNTASTP